MLKLSQISANILNPKQDGDSNSILLAYIKQLTKYDQQTSRTLTAVIYQLNRPYIKGIQI